MQHWFSKWAASLLLVFSLSAAAGEWHALVIGANRYSDGAFDDLNGAVNDAELLAAALQAQGVTPTVLLDEAATYDAISQWWQQTLPNLSSGDSVFFSFAGHGAREAEHFPGSEAANAQAEGDSVFNALDEVLVLPAYSNAGAASRERLVDNELLGWFKAATDKGAQVLAVADACYGGGLTRSALSGNDYGDPLAVVRNSGQGVLQPDDRTPRGTAESARLRVSDGDTFANRLFYAVPYLDENKLVPELVAGGQAHGALSYLMAQTLAGQAQGENGEPPRTAADIARYLGSGSLQLSNGAQQAHLVGVNRANKDTPLLPGSQAVAEALFDGATVFPVYAQADCAAQLDAENSLLRLVDVPQQAAFRWQCDKGVVLKTGIGVVAYDVDSTAKLAAFLRQQQLLDGLRALNLPRFDGAVFPDRQQDLRTRTVNVFEANDDIAVYFAAPQDFTHLFALNIPAKGDVQLVAAGNMAQLQRLPSDEENGTFDTILGRSTITPPFGSDTLLLVAMNDNAVAGSPLWQKLQQQQTAPKADALLGALQSLTTGDAAVAFVPFATVDKQGGQYAN